MTLWTVAHQAPLSLGFSRKEYRSGLPCPPPGDLPDPGIESKFPMSPELQVDFFFKSSEPSGKYICIYSFRKIILYANLLFQGTLVLIAQRASLYFHISAPFRKNIFFSLCFQTIIVCVCS